MNPLRLTTLKEQDMPVLRQTFLEAFADYLVPIKLSAEQFAVKRKREGVEPAFCVVAFDGPKMVGFIITGLGEWKGKPTAYNAGTGVIPAYRNQKLTQKLYDYLIQKLKECSIEQCLLEVIQENTPALKSYQHVGLAITRSLDCFRALKNDLLLQAPAPETLRIAKAGKPAWGAYQEWWDMMPTWQNSVNAVKRTLKDVIILEAWTEGETPVGYIIFYPKSGSIVQFAVDNRHRGSGIGSALLREAVKLTETTHLLLINVDTVATGFSAFIKRRHFQLFLSQYEMLMPLS
ncbi:GNAT family N-acetyltransferase [Pontibacter sp. MBLB2868]|uniref:GNAT family N-acetyltransferase n=1 Tax=Pontibacter sp. MBLB2868 TaxID=3451555 RepID=UPI003F755C98